MTITETEEARAVFVLCRDEIKLDFDTDTAAELYGSIETSHDFTMEIGGGEYRFIEEAYIREIAQEEIWDTICECYLSQTAAGKDGELPWWIEIDEEKTVQNCIDSDGYGHHFSSYDGNEYETGDWYVFRTN